MQHGDFENGKIEGDWKCPIGDSGNILANNSSVRNMKTRSQMVAVLRNIEQNDDEDLYSHRSFSDVNFDKYNSIKYECHWKTHKFGPV